MPLISEITSGASFERSSEEGRIADRTTRVFRIISDAPGVPVDVQAACGIQIGSIHPQNPDVYCTSFSVNYDGESRMVLLATFNYQSTAGSGNEKEDPKSQPPDVRPANWTTSTSLIEMPVYKWWPRTGASSWASLTDAVNSAGDIYEGISQLTGLVNISVTQEFVTDPTINNQYSGYINDEEIRLGTLRMAPHTVMFRGVQSQPYVEHWGGSLFRGWRATYEFAYKKNETKINPYNLVGEAAAITVDLGWDIAVPQSGHNVIAFTPNTAGANDDVFGQPLLHGDAQATDPPAAGMPSAAVMQQYAGVVVPPAGGGYYLPANVQPGKRMPAMIQIFSYDNGNKGSSQARASSPVPLNFNGRPRNESADPKVLVYGYQVQPSINFTNTLGLRLY